MAIEGTGDEPYVMGHAQTMRETPQSLLIAIRDLAATVWIPRRAIHVTSELPACGLQEGNLVLVRWFVESQGWDE